MIEGPTTTTTWHGQGCTLIITPILFPRGVAQPVTARVGDRDPMTAGLARTLVVAALVQAPEVALDARRPTGRVAAGGAPAGSDGVLADRLLPAAWQVAFAADGAPPVRDGVAWDTAGDAAPAWDAIRGLRSGLSASAGAIGLAVALGHPSGAETMPLDPAGVTAAIGVPWLAWSDGLFACVVASGTDGGEPYWDVAVVGRVAPGDNWTIAFRAMAYLPALAPSATDPPDPVRSRPGPPDAAGSAAPESPDALVGLPLPAPGGNGGASAATSASVHQISEIARPSVGDGPPTDGDADLGRGSKARADPGLATGSAGAPAGRRLPAAIRPVVRAIDAFDVAQASSPLGGARLPRTLFWVGIATYLVTRLWGIADYPIAFDGDEAAIVVLARNLVDGRFRDGYGIWFPLFFSYPNWNPDVSVYVHVVTSSIFGTSVTVARATSVLLTLPAPVALAATLKWGFGARGWWVAPYLLSALPVWFHLSRSAYDSATWATFFACAVAAYARYRYHDPRWALHYVGALLLTFYSNSVAHLFAALLATATLAIDWRYHRAHWRSWRLPGALAIVGMLPLVTFLSKNPAYLVQRLDSTHPHWGDGTRGIAEVAATVAKAAAVALHPMVWFVTENRGRYADVTGYHNYYPGTLPLLPWWVGPLVLAGLGSLALSYFRGRRALLLALVAIAIAPTAIARFAPTRSLAAVVPLVLLATCWVDAVMPRGRRLALAIGAIAVAVTTASAAGTLAAAMTTQATRVQDYGGFGIQWGSKEVFALVNRRLRASPNARVMVTTDWTWGAHHFIKFFVDRAELAAGRVFLGSLETILKSRDPWGPELWAILSPAQLAVLRERMVAPPGASTGPRVVEAEVTDEVAHPDGSPGFLMVRLREAKDVTGILAAERAAANRPTYSAMSVGGQRAAVGTTAIDDGQVEPVLNGTPNALVRFSGPNPTIIDVAYEEQAVPVSRMRLVLGAGLWSVTARLYRDGSLAVVDASGPGVPDGPNSVAELRVAGGPVLARRIVYEILQPNATEDDSTVHLYEVAVGP